MPPVLGPVIAIAKRACDPGLWPIASTLLAIDHDNKAGFFTVEKFLDHYSGAGFAPKACRRALSRTAFSASARVMATITLLRPARRQP